MLRTAGEESIVHATFDPLELYASGIDTSDYVQRIAPLIQRFVPKIGHLLDVGAGGGQLGASLRCSGRKWTAIEPSLTMTRRLRALPDPPRIIPCGWAEARASHHRHDTVLAANMAAPMNAAVDFLAACREWTRDRIVWLVPAQNGPRGLCLAGCLPRHWHGEDETPGIEIVLRQLPEADHPEQVLKADWSFHLVVPDIRSIAAYLADRLGWAADDPRRPALRDHLEAAAEPVPGGYRLTVPRTSAVMIWTSEHEG